MGTGVPPGLQNLCWALEASWVGSIPTCLRQNYQGRTLKIQKEHRKMLFFAL